MKDDKIRGHVPFVLVAIAVFFLLTYLRPGWESLRLVLPEGSDGRLFLDLGHGFQELQSWDFSAEDKALAEVLDRRLRGLRWTSRVPSSDELRIRVVHIESKDREELILVPVAPGVWEATDLDLQSRITTPALRLAHLSFAVLVGASLMLLRAFWRFARGGRENLRTALASVLLFAASISVLVTWLLGQWPGLYSQDPVRILLDYTMRYQLDPWFSWVFCEYLLVFYGLFQHPGMICVAQINLVALGTSYFLVRAGVQGAPWVLIALCWLFFYGLPLNAAVALSIYKNSVFEVLVAMLALYFPASYIGKQRVNLPNGHIVLLALYSTLVASMRAEAFVIVPTLMVLALLLKVFSPRSLLKLAACLVLAHLGINSLAPRLLEVRDVDDYYRSNITFGPLLYIIGDDDYRTADREEDRRVIDRYIDYDAYMAHFQEYGFRAQAGIGVRPLPKDSEEAKAIYRAYMRKYAEIVMRNPDRFLANRLFWARESLALDNNRYVSDRLHSEDHRLGYTTSRYFNETFPWDDEVADRFIRQTRIEKAPVSMGLYAVQRRYFDFVFFDSKVLRFLSSNAVSLAGLLLVACLLPVCRMSGMAACIILSRLVLVFLTAPYGGPKYYYSAYFALFLLIPFVWIEWNAYWRRKSKP